MNRYFASAAVALALAMTAPAAASAGSADVDPSITDGTAAKEFKEARATWLATGITNYRFVITPSCFCYSVDPVKITVRGKRVKLSNRDWFGPRTIPGLFKLIHGAIHRDAASLDTTYSKSRGFPRRVAIDYDRMMADEEISYTVTKFRKLKSTGR